MFLLQFLCEILWLPSFLPHSAAGCLFVVRGADRQAVRPSRPHTYHLLSVWRSSRELASISQVKQATSMTSCKRFASAAERFYSVLCELNISTSINGQSVYGFTFSAWERGRRRPLLMGLIVGQNMEERWMRGGMVVVVVVVGFHPLDTLLEAETAFTVVPIIYFLLTFRNFILKVNKHHQCSSASNCHDHENYPSWKV